MAKATVSVGVQTTQTIVVNIGKRPVKFLPEEARELAAQLLQLADGIDPKKPETEKESPKKDEGKPEPGTDI